MDAPDRLMLTLLSMSVASRGRYSPDGRQFVRVEIDELERRTWVELLPPRPDAPEDRAEVTLTDRGGYWLQRWLKANRRRLRGLLEQFQPGRRPDLAIEVHPVRASAC